MMVRGKSRRLGSAARLPQSSPPRTPVHDHVAASDARSSPGPATTRLMKLTSEASPDGRGQACPVPSWFRVCPSRRPRAGGTRGCLPPPDTEMRSDPVHQDALADLESRFHRGGWDLVRLDGPRLDRQREPDHQAMMSTSSKNVPRLIGSSFIGRKGKHST